MAEHPDAVIALRFRDELGALVSVMLSAQTTDVTVNRVTQRLFRKYRTPEDYLAVPEAELEADIRPHRHVPAEGTQPAQGYARPHRRSSTGACRRDSTTSSGSPGVGRKTANVVAAERGATQGVVVDTHVRRLSQRLGSRGRRTPARSSRICNGWFPSRTGRAFRTF